MSDRRQSLLVAHGALVFLLGMAAGFPFTFAALGRMPLWPFAGDIVWTGPGDVRAWRMAHLEGILNGLLLIAVSAIAARLSLTERAQGILYWSLLITAWANTVASFMGPLVSARGLSPGGTLGNTLMFILFTAAVITVIVALVLVAVGALRRARIDASA